MTQPELSKEEALLLLKLERIVGKAFHNEHIRNYEGRDLYTEGRDFRYPVTTWTKVDDRWQPRKHPQLSSDDPPERILNACYMLGANQLLVFRALYRALRLLKLEGTLKVEGFDNLQI